MPESEIEPVQKFPFTKYDGNTLPVEKDFHPHPVSSDTEVEVPKARPQQGVLARALVDSQVLESELIKEESEEEAALVPSDNTSIQTPTIA